MKRAVLKHHYRLFYRNGTSAVVHGRAELAAAQARKVPGIVHVEIALQHTCIQCGVTGPWSKDWICYPIWDRIAAYHNNAQAEVIYCSRRCWVEATGGFDLPSWINTNHEPNRDRARQVAWWDANRRETDRKRDLVQHRRVPMPEWKEGSGLCRWCAEKIEEPRQRNWHKECAHTYELHSNAATQAWFLKRRDGQRCAIDGCNGGGCGLEVDHRIPLWLVAHLPDDLRRRFYGPDNLWLLCSRHHAEKTAAEAAIRAAIRRGDAQAPEKGPFLPLWGPPSSFSL